MKSIQKILVPVDYSTASAAAFESALALAKAFDAGIEVLHVWSDGGHLEENTGPEVLESLATSARQRMRSFLAEIVPPPGVTITSRVQPGAPAEVITELSDDYDLIVMGTHGRSGLERWLVGSVATKVVQHARCPVMTVRERESRAEKKTRKAPIVYAMFEDKKHIETAFTELVSIGVPVERISLVMSEDTHDRAFKMLDRTKALEGATAGGLMAGTVGGILGGLIGVGSIVTGGIGLIVMGPALAFAAAGGLLGGLLGRTVPDDRAMVLKAELAEGKTLMAVHLDDASRAEEIRALTRRCGGEPFYV